MAQLNSPGVSVQVIDESFYTPAAPGTTPLIFVATEQDKPNAAGTGTAQGTTAANAGKVYLITSQKELADTFGTPTFKTDANNNPVHAGEQNEYGLQAAYSYLGVSNRAFVVRANVDLGQLDGQADAPAGPAADGQFWFDTANTKFGIFQWNGASGDTTNGQTFVNKVPEFLSEAQISNGAPKDSVGAIGDYAMVLDSAEYSLWFKKPETDGRVPAGTWVLVGSLDWAASWPTVQSTKVVQSEFNSGWAITINESSPITGNTSVSALATAINSANITGVTASGRNGILEIYSTGTAVTISGTSNLFTLLGLVAGTYYAPATQITPHTSVPAFKRTSPLVSASGYPTGSVWIKTTEPNLGARWRVKVYSDASASWVEKSAPLYSSSAAALKGIDPTGGGINLPQGSLYVKYNQDEVYSDGSAKLRPNSADFKIYARRSSGATTILSSVITDSVPGSGSYAFTLSETVTGSNTVVTKPEITVTLTGSAVSDADAIASAISGAGFANVVATVTTENKIQIKHSTGGDIGIVDTDDLFATIFEAYNVDGNGVQTGTVNFYNSPDTTNTFVASLWSPFADIASSATAPVTEAPDGQLWYSSLVDEVDIMVHDGEKWSGYKNVVTDADPAGPIISATKPLTQSDGTSLVNGDLWIDTSDLENYPAIYKFSTATQKWVSVDTSDQTTDDGIIFADARAGVDGGTWNSATQTGTAPAGTIAELLTEDFVDFDAPDPALYPKGMLLWNLRRSGFNVKKFVRSYVDQQAENTWWNNSELMTTYYPHRWVTESANQESGAGTFGRKAQRAVVIQALQSLINSNQEIRDEESRIFNLIATPGYPELIGEMTALNYDRGLTAFVIGDTPARLASDATSLNNWGSNVAGAVEDNDKGLVSFDEYLGVFYPWGYTSDNVGNNIVVPPSHMILRTIALNDQVSYPWFAPAGTRRGGITNATAVGYITAEGEFQSVALNTGQRDTLAANKVNPITFITGTGLVNYGQYTRAKNASSLDRINVARLVIYLRRQFALLAKPYVFEPNDKITRDELKGAAESLLLELVGQRAIYDYIVVCDTSNNTPARIDRNELYLDVAIEPVKAVEFIYIPLRLKNTGEIAGLNQ